MLCPDSLNAGSSLILVASCKHCFSRWSDPKLHRPAMPSYCSKAMTGLLRRSPGFAVNSCTGRGQFIWTTSNSVKAEIHHFNHSHCFILNPIVLEHKTKSTENSSLSKNPEPALYIVVWFKWASCHMSRTEFWISVWNGLFVILEETRGRVMFLPLCSMHHCLYLSCWVCVMYKQKGKEIDAFINIYMKVNNMQCLHIGQSFSEYSQQIYK